MRFDLIKIFSVAELNNLVKFQLESNIVLKSFFVKGEVSGVTQQKHPSGRRTWFTLKGAGSEISCVSWNGCEVSDGDAVEIKGKIEVWNNKGQYKLNVAELKAVGDGEEKEALAKLTAELEKKGYFDPRNKKPLPDTMKRLALVTSEEGAAVGDVLHTLLSRESIIHVRIYDVRVQGASAPKEISDAIRAINRSEEEVDAILLTRGGGGKADLSVFNDPMCFEAVFQSRIPVICAIGHERDESLCEKCADLRCITPTKAAIVVSERSSGSMYYARAKALAISVLERVAKRLDHLNRELLSIRIVSPKERIHQRKLRLVDLQNGILKHTEYYLKSKTTSLENLALRIEASSPFAILEKGYGLVYQGGKVTDMEGMKVGDEIRILMKRGTISAEVKGVNFEDIRAKI